MKKRPKMQDVYVNGQLVASMLDTGPECTVMSYALFKRLNLKRDESLRGAVLTTINSSSEAFRS